MTLKLIQLCFLCKDIVAGADFVPRSSLAAVQTSIRHISQMGSLMVRGTKTSKRWAKSTSFIFHFLFLLLLGQTQSFPFVQEYRSQCFSIFQIVCIFPFLLGSNF